MSRVTTSAEALAGINWRRLEDRYPPISPEVRSQIEGFTESYRRNDRAEFNAFFLQDIEKYLLEFEKRLKAALQKTQLLTHYELAGSSRTSDRAAVEYAAEFLRSNQGLSPLDVRTAIRSWVASSASARAELRAETGRGFTEGAAWKAWVRKMHILMGTHGLPSTISKPSSRYQGISHFVVLIKTIQEEIPDLRWVPPKTDGALSQAIYNAIKAHKE